MPMSRPMLVSRFSPPNRSAATLFGALKLLTLPVLTRRVSTRRVSTRRVSTRRVSTLLALVLVCVAASGCSGLIGSDQAEPAASSESTGTSSTAEPGDQPEDLASTAPGSALTCKPVSEDPIGTVQRSDLIEASGVVASRTHSHNENAVLWSHNDSGGSAGVFAFDTDGNDLGFFELAAGALNGRQAVDIEDIAINDGKIYLADIGDNARARDAVTIYVFDEPTPGADGAIAASDAITVRYPDGPTDAEALLVDPVTRDLVILGKDLDDSTAPTTIYVLPAESSSGSEPVELVAEGTIDVADLTRQSSAFSLGGIAFPGAATGMDITDDGSLIALRTYGSVWLFERPAGMSVAEALAAEPCEGGAEAESQGESVGFLPPDPDGLIRYVTVSEGRNPAVNLSVLEINPGS